MSTKRRADARNRLIRRGPLHEEVAARLRDMIIEQALPPGAPLNEQDLCGQLGVSRTPLREAVKILAAEGLIELLPRRGSRISIVSPDDVATIFEVLAGLERTAAELAALRIAPDELASLRRLQARIELYHSVHQRHEYYRDNEDLHRAIVRFAHNPILEDMHNRLMSHVRRARFMALYSQERWDESVREHREILAAIESGNASQAGAFMHRHVCRTSAAARSQPAPQGT